MMRTINAIIAIVIVAIIAFAAGYYIYPSINLTQPVQQKTLWDKIKERGYIVVATSPDWPPFEFIDPQTNELVGYEVDLMNAIGEKLGIEVRWKTMEFDTIIAAVKNGEVDLGVSGFSVTPERFNEVSFCMPHIVTEVQLIMTVEKANELGITRLKSLSEIKKYNIVVGTGQGTTEEQELLDLVNKGVIPSGLVKSFTDFQIALEDLKAGRVDAVYAETPITTWWISTESVPLTVVYSRSYWPVAFITMKGEYELVNHINAALAEIFASGQIDEIRAKWNVSSGL